MMRPVRSLWPLLALAMTLSACHSQQKAGHGEVSGQILPGSVSDAMLPYDAVKSKAPPAPPEPVYQANNSGGSDAADSAVIAASGDSAVPDIAASPAPAAPVGP